MNKIEKNLFFIYIKLFSFNIFQLILAIIGTKEKIINMQEMLLCILSLESIAL